VINFAYPNALVFLYSVNGNTICGKCYKISIIYFEKT
jgi:hypothetical protein